MKSAFVKISITKEAYDSLNSKSPCEVCKIISNAVTQSLVRKHLEMLGVNVALSTLIPIEQQT